MKKLNKFFAVLVALAMMATLCVSMAFAADYDSEAQAVTGGTEASPAHGYLTKTLQMPEGTTTPDADFVFDWTQKTTGTGIQTATADVTKLEGTLEFNGEEGTTADTVKKVVKSYDFANVAAFTKAGRYQFDVVETANTNAAIDAASNTNETLTYSQEKYLVTIDVANGESGLYIANIAVQEYKADGTLGEKVNPSKPTGGEGSDFNYTNTYVKTLNTTPDGEDPKDPDNPSKDNTGLFIQKDVAPYGTETLTDADKAVPFTFTVTINRPSLSEKTSYTAKVVDTNAADTTAAIATYTFNMAAVEAAEGVEAKAAGTDTQTVTLKHGQRLVFTDLDVGATYEVAETADSGYTTAIVKTAADEESNIAGLTASGKITEKKDSAAYTNTRASSNTPTGILFSNLPYIALALVAIGGLVAYVVVRRRQSDEA